MPRQKAQQIEGLELWTPSDSFSQAHNLDSLYTIMPNLQALTLLHKPGEETIYCGDNDQTIYHMVEEAAVDERERRLHGQDGPLRAAVRADQQIAPADFHEESRMRELNLGMGRAALMLAWRSEQSTDFKSAASDLKETFGLLEEPIHEIGELSDTSHHDSGLIYLFVQAARKFKSLSPEEATAISDALGQALLPFPTGRKGYASDTWNGTRARNFIERVSFSQYKPASTAPRAPRPKATRDKKNSFKIYPEKAKKVTAERTRAEVFIAGILGDRTHKKYPVKLAKAHKKFCGKDAEPFEIRNDTRVDTSRLAVAAYLEAFSQQPNDIAGQILEYLSKGRDPRRPLLPLISIGNLATAKLNAAGGLKGKDLPLPGLSVKSIPKGFEVLRHLLEASPGAKDDQKFQQAKMLGDITAQYLQQAFPPNEEIDYQILPAPDDYISTRDFAMKHGLNQRTLEHVLNDYGIDPPTYLFEHHARKALGADDRKLLLEALQDLRVPEAPRGYRSISGFAGIFRTDIETVKALIDEHDVSVGRHRFRSKLGASLSPQAQQQLIDLLEITPHPSYLPRAEDEQPASGDTEATPGE